MRRRKFFSVFLAFLLVVCFLYPQSSWGYLGDDHQEPLRQEPLRDEGGLFERAVAEIFNAIFKVLWGLLDRWGFKDLDRLIFDQPQEWDNLLYPAPFSPQQWANLDRLYYGMMLVSWGLYLILVLVASGRFMAGGLSKTPEARAEGKGTLWRMILALVIMAGAPVIVRAMFVLANAVHVGIVEVAEAARVDAGGMVGRGFVEDLRTGSALGTALVKFAFAFVTFQVNLIFWVRDAVMSVMYVFTPLMAVLWAANRNVMAAAVWIGELLSNAFLPAAYALAGAVVVLLLGVGDIGWPQKLVGVIILVTLANTLRNGLQGLWTRWAGVDEEGMAGKVTAGFAGAFGLGGVLGAGRAFSAGMASPRHQLSGGPSGSFGPGGPDGGPSGGTGPWGVVGPARFSGGGFGGAALSGPGGSLGGAPGFGGAASSGPGGSLGGSPGPGGTAPVSPQAEARAHALQAVNRFNQVGYYAGRVTGGTVGILGAPGSAAMSEGRSFLRAAARGTAKMTEGAAVLAGLGYGTYQVLKAQEGGLAQKLVQAPGAAIGLYRDYRQLAQTKGFDGYRPH